MSYGLRTWLVQLVNNETGDEITVTVEAGDRISAQVRALEEQFGRGWHQLTAVSATEVQIDRKATR